MSTPTPLSPDDLSEKTPTVAKLRNAAKKPDNAGGLTKFQKFEARTIHRSQIKNAPYNPRTIDPEPKARLKKNLKTVGLLGGILWNEVTGNLLAGHQRLNLLDELEGSQDYSLTVDVCQLDAKKEKEQNVFLNSPSAQGRYNFDALADLLPSIDAGLAGLDEFDLAQMGARVNFDDMAGSSVLPYMPPPTPSQDRTPEEKQAAKEQIQEKRQAAGSVLDTQNTVLGESHVTLSFSSVEAKEAFLMEYGWPGDMRMIKGEQLTERLHFQHPSKDAPPF